MEVLALLPFENSAMEIEALAKNVSARISTRKFFKDLK